MSDEAERTRALEADEALIASITAQLASLTTASAGTSEVTTAPSTEDTIKIVTTALQQARLSTQPHRQPTNV